jgi:hypothetical protein
MSPKETYLRNAEQCRVMVDQARDETMRESYRIAREAWLKLAESETLRESSYRVATSFPVFQRGVRAT